MNSLSSVLAELSSELGVDLSSQENNADMASLYEIRFAGLDNSKSFSLNLERSWKTTLIRFQPDVFAGDVVHYLCEKIGNKRDQIAVNVELNKSSYSSISLEIDGKPLSGIPDVLSKNPTFSFEVEALTSESSIQYGLVNEQEENLLRFAVSLIASVLPIEKIVFRHADEVIGYPEGAVSKVFVNRYERDPRNRRNAIDIHGHICLACGFNFQAKYGELGEEYIVVHHTVPVSKMGNDYVVDPAKDLVTLCANCHAMVHRQEPPLSVEELRRILSI
jgi:5-methylcytosine-specific restriction protein A